MAANELIVAAMITSLAAAPNTIGDKVAESERPTTVTQQRTASAPPEELAVITLPPTSTISQPAPSDNDTSTTSRPRVSEPVEVSPDSQNMVIDNSDMSEVVTAGNIPGVSLELEQRFDRLSQCESNGDWSINTGNGYYGGIQFYPPTWISYGGGEFAESAHLATREEQMQIGAKVLDGQGWGAWPACSRSFGWI